VNIQCSLIKEITDDRWVTPNSVDGRKSSQLPSPSASKNSVLINSLVPLLLSGGE
jgi:hypothetical protein